ncbi:MAG TPA: ABC transporter permease [Jatrophihabitans sp.]|nr:ABC transporter permease [Jatrophihabitans sp.]
MTVVLDKNSGDGPSSPSGDEDLTPDGRRGFGRRMLDAYLYGNQIVVTFLAFLCALVVGSILIAIADPPTRKAMGYFFQHPSDTFDRAWQAIAAAYTALFRGSILNPASLYSNGGVAIFGPISDTLLNAAPLILGGLAVTVAFRAGLFNIGVQGQLIMGAIAAGYVGFAISLPPFVHLVVALIAGVVGGALWGGLVGWLKAATGAHEVITTIMLNYVAVYFLVYLLTLNGFQEPGSNQAISRVVKSTARLPHLFGDLHFGIIIALAAAVASWWLLSRSTLGFRIRAVGANHFAARTAGMPVERSYVTVMVISGALAGLVGCSQILGTNTQLTGSIDAGFGFDAITVALLGRGTPLGTVLAGLLFGAFRSGGVVMAAQTTTPYDVVTVIEAVIVLFIAAPALVRGIFRLRASRGGGVGQLAKGWNG